LECITLVYIDLAMADVRNNKRYRGIKLTKSLGQHILSDKRYLSKIIENCDFDRIDAVLEVGSGPGNLTDLLLEQDKTVIAVELDKRFADKLTYVYRDNPRLKLFECDILSKGKLNPLIVDELRKFSRWALVSNLPYNVAGTVIIESLYCDWPADFICATVQKEVAQRLSAEPASKTYSPLSVMAQAVSKVEIVSVIPPGAFVPHPKVYSAIVKINYVAQLADRLTDMDFFSDFVHRLFRHRRKTLRSGWIKYLPENVQQRTIDICDELGIVLSQRPETLSVEQIISLSKGLRII